MPPLPKITSLVRFLTDAQMCLIAAFIRWVIRQKHKKKIMPKRMRGHRASTAFAFDTLFGDISGGGAKTQHRKTKQTSIVEIRNKFTKEIVDLEVSSSFSCVAVVVCLLNVHVCPSTR